VESQSSAGSPQCRPAFGICWALQLLFEGSDEGKAEGLGLLKGRGAGLAGQAPVIRSAHGLGAIDPPPSHTPPWPCV